MTAIVAPPRGGAALATASRRLWWLALVVALAIGAAAVVAPVALLALAGVAAAAAFVALTVRNPRAGLVVVLLLLVGYVPDAVGANAHLPVSTQALIGVVALAVLAQPEWRARARRLGPEAAAFAALIGTMLLAAAFATSTSAAWSRVADQTKDAVLVLLVVTVIDSTVWLRRAMGAFAIAGIGLATLTIMQQVTHAYASTFGGFAVTLPYANGYRSEGPLSSNFFAQMLVLSTVFVLYLTLTRERPAFVLGGAGALACLTAIAYTYSRGALIALVVAFVTVAVLRRWRPSRIAAIVLVATLGVLILPTDFRDRIGALAHPTATNGIDTSTRGRLSENLAALQMFEYHPLIGVGPANFDVHYLDYSQFIGLDPRTEPRQPHDLYLEVLSERGLVGAIAFAWVMGFAALGAWRARARSTPGLRDVAECSLVALVVVFTCGVFLHAAYARYIWITVAFALVARRLALETRST
jgi:O-antigen ligase